jgi:hypothetical protein
VEEDDDEKKSRSKEVRTNVFEGPLAGFSKQQPTATKERKNQVKREKGRGALSVREIQ